jgi:hypothetical protein
MGGAHPSHPPCSLCSKNSVHSRGDGGSSIHSNTDGVLPPGEFLTQVAEVVLRISPTAGSAMFGYIYLNKNERHQEDPITAYFNSAGRDVVPIPCPDFNAFMAAYRLSNRDVVFLMDLPRHVIPAGIRILQANCYDDSPNLDWMPAPPDFSSFPFPRLFFSLVPPLKPTPSLISD